MVRPWSLVLLLLCACGEPGLRDRSLMARVEPGVEAAAPATENPPTVPVHAPYVGLVPDSLAIYYAENAELVVRFSDLATLRGTPAQQLGAVRTAFPELGLPGLDPVHLVRHVLGLSNAVAINIVRPFAFVKVKDGWVAVLASRSFPEAGPRMKALDAIYVVAGDPELVAAYEPGFRTGHYLPGDCSVLARPDVVPQIGTKLTGITHLLGLDLEFLDGWCEAVPDGLERVDIAARFGGKGLRIDVRAAPAADSPAAVLLRKLKPAAGATQHRLPAGGAVYLECVCAPRDWAGLATLLWPHLADGAVPEAERRPWRDLTSLFGADTSATIQLDGKGGASVVVIGHVADAARTRVFLESQEMRHLLKSIAGAAGHLEFRPEEGPAAGPVIGTISGSISHRRLLGWRSSGDPVLASLSLLMQGPLLCRIAIHGNQIFLVMGERARQGTSAFFQHLASGAKVDNDHAHEVGSLFQHRLAAVTIDLGGLYDGTLEAAPFWHENGRILRTRPIGRKLPLTAAVTVEGGALRAALRLQPDDVAAAARRIARLLK